MINSTGLPRAFSPRNDEIPSSRGAVRRRRDPVKLFIMDSRLRGNDNEQ